MEEFQRTISELKGDYIHGSSWYFERIAELLTGINLNDLKLLVKSIDEIRPGMASISNIGLVLKTSKIESDEDLRKVGRLLVKYRKRAANNLKSEARKLRIRSAITISYSSAVKTFIESAGLEELLLLKSSPGNEYKVAEKDYGAICNVTVIPDSASYAFINSVEAVIIGFDGLYSNGYLINKIGSVPLCLSAREAGIDVYAIGESFKASDYPAGKIMERKIGHKNPSIIPLFDRVPLYLINSLITDVGAFRQPSNETIRIIHDIFLKAVYL